MIDRRWRNALLQALAIGVTLAVITWLAIDAVQEYAFGALETTQLAQSQAMAQIPALTATWAQGELALQPLVQEWTRVSGKRITLLDQAGVVVADSHDPSLRGSALHEQPEVAAALAGKPGLAYRSNPPQSVATTTDSGTDAVPAPQVDNERILFTAVPVLLDGGLVGVLRLGRSTAVLDASMGALEIRMYALGALAALLLIGLMLFQVQRTAHTVRRLTEAAERITAGELDVRVLTLSSGDIGQLTRAFNRMAGKLENQIHKRSRERDRLNTVMHAMADGVLILNRKGKVRMINPAAAHLLNTSVKKARKRTFVQAVRDHRIAEVWIRCRESGQQEVAALELDTHRFLSVIVTPFLDEADRGYVVLLQDLTQMRQLQTTRQDFVSNVSHELRTPLASMRALVDTLRDGAIDDPPVAHHFLDRMEVEVDSLAQMVEELLELSRIESGKMPLRLAFHRVEEVLVIGAERLRPQAERSGIELIIDLLTDLPPVLVDPTRIQQVVTNLVHNAIKFTPAGGRVTISATLANGVPPAGDKDQDDVNEEARAMVVVSVTDNGAGIAPRNLPRIFERFYKTDPARASGGTGLGLAIAKHIVQAHGGDIWAESEGSGKGSAFFFTLLAV